jgi:DNA polymerase III epsilon subunit-like protein
MNEVLGFDNMLKEELKTECRNLKLKVGGTKKDLIERLTEYTKNNTFDAEEKTEENVEKNKKLFFDLETSGLPIRKKGQMYPPNQLKYYDNCRMIEIAYIIYNNDGSIFKEVSNIIKPTTFNITNDKFHGITHQHALNTGITIEDMLKILISDLNYVDTIISHNIDFDYNILISECHRIDNNEIIDNLKLKNQFCTLKEGKKRMHVSKYPKLTELYKFLFKTEIKQDHRALEDSRICADCYFKLFEKNNEVATIHFINEGEPDIYNSDSEFFIGHGSR